MSHCYLLLATCYSATCYLAPPITVADTKHLEKCGVLGFITMGFTGMIFGVFGVVGAHLLMTRFGAYSLILICPIVMALILGFGLSTGAKIGRCCRLSIAPALLVLVLAILCYGVLLFLNAYYNDLNIPNFTLSTRNFTGLKNAQVPEKVLESLKPLEEIGFQQKQAFLNEVEKLLGKEQTAKYQAIILQHAQQSPLDNLQTEALTVVEEGQNFLGTLPFVSNYVKPVENSQLGNLGTKFLDFFKAFPDKMNATPVGIGTVFGLGQILSVRNYLEYPGITKWDMVEEQLVFDAPIIKTWMLWATEFLLVFLIALVMARGGAHKAYAKRVERLKKAGYSPERMSLKSTKEKEKKEKKKKHPKEEPEPDVVKATLPSAPEEKTGEAEPKPRKKWFSFFGGKKKAKTPSEETPATETEAETEEKAFEEAAEESQEKRYALILYQYDLSRQNDLLQLIQQVGQVPEERARRLLKTPALIKQDVSTKEAEIAIGKFQQLQAQVKVITMEQLTELQKKQQPQAAQPASPQVPPSAPAQPQPTPPGSPEERYALILRKFDPARKKEVLDLLSKLSKTPVAQLQKTLEPPVSILRDATKDEVTMIAQQFKNLQADVIVLTMEKLQKLMAKK